MNSVSVRTPNLVPVLFSNFLRELRPRDWQWLRHSLGQAFLGENELSQLRAGTFSSFHRLVSLNLDGNQLRQLPADAVPEQLQMLTVNGNQLRQLPLLALRKLRRLNWVYFRGGLSG